MKKPRFPSDPIRRDRRAARGPSAAAASSRRGFTLVEVLVAMTVLVLIIAMLAQVVGNTTSSIQRSTKGMDSSHSATVALDRLGESLAGMVTRGEGTLVAIKNPNGSDGLAMIANERVRSRTSGTNVSVDGYTNIRLGARGFCVISAPDPDLPPVSGGGTFPSVPMLHWGDGTISWNSQSAAGVQGDPSKALSMAATDVQNQTSTMLQFTPLSRSIFRFELAFLLSNGTTVSGRSGGSNLALLSGFSAAPAPLPRNKYFVTNEVFANPPVHFESPAYPLAFNAADSDAAPDANSGGQNIYVRAVIVGIATLDPNTQRLLTPTQITTLASTDTLPKATDGATPVQGWDISSSSATTYTRLQSPNFPSPVLQNIRFTQRAYYVH